MNTIKSLAARIAVLEAQMRKLLKQDGITDHLHRRDVAEHYHVSLTTVDRWRERGCPYQNSGRPEFSLAKVEAWRAAHAHRPQRRVWRSG